MKESWSSPETNRAKTKEKMTHFSMARIRNFQILKVESRDDGNREGEFIERNRMLFFFFFCIFQKAAVLGYDGIDEVLLKRKKVALLLGGVKIS